jgi:hypothetical protein
LGFRKIYAKEKRDESEEQPQSRTVIRRGSRLIFGDSLRTWTQNRNSYSQTVEIEIAIAKGIRRFAVSSFSCSRVNSSSGSGKACHGWPTLQAVSLGGNLRMPSSNHGRLYPAWTPRLATVESDILDIGRVTRTAVPFLSD